ncbi:MAG: HAMP domain-containing histidine kinase [Oscillospiraceae bacterium]|nr:HAMP domain-containing histidine kinase [Oscillospiraceae bacterium]
MDQFVVNAFLELTGGPSFVVRAGKLECCNPAAQALGLREGQSVSAALPDAVLPKPGEGPVESDVVLSDHIWTLRAVPAELLCFCSLRPGASLSPPPNDTTMLYIAGSIRYALQDLSVALDGIGGQESKVLQPLSRQAALAMRGVYRLRRTAGDLELFARLRAGTFRLNRQECRLVIAFDQFCRETADLLESAELQLSWQLPPSDFSAVLDWPLTRAMLRELIANAAAHSSDRLVRLELTRIGMRRVCFAVRNQADRRPDQPFHRYAQAESSDLNGGLGVGLSLVSQGAACHGGTLVFSTEEDGETTVLLTLPLGEQEDLYSRSSVQYPEAEEHPGLTAFSTILPPEAFAPENL